jgi:septin family protein
MKILLVGAQGTGKSVLARELQNKHPYLALIDGIHRQAQQDGFEINKTNDAVSQIITIERYLRKVNKYLSNFISVSPIIRQYAYARCNKLPDYVLNLMNTLCILESQCFAEYVFYLPIEFPLVGDGIRDENIEYQKVIDREIQELLDHYYSFEPNYFIIRGSVEERVKDIEDIAVLRL